MQSIIAETITIGDEILYGQTLDTNSHKISGILSSLGIRVLHKTTVSDDKKQILDALETARKRANLIIMTGGLGPTKDDITKKTLAEFFGTHLILNEDVLTHVKSLLEKRGRTLNDLNRMQAYVPAVSEVLHNELGTAPGMWTEHEGKVFISLPGVPHETMRIMSDYGFPKIKAFFNPPVIFHKKIKLIGIPESVLAMKIEAWEDSLPEHIKLAYLPHQSKVTLRLTATGKDLLTLERETQEQVEKVMPLIERYVYGFDEEELETNLGNLLTEKGLTLAVAESCTGGFLGHTFTQHAGSSQFFKGGVIAYTNEVKHHLLGVSQLILDEFTEVSEPCVKSMAINAREKFKTDFALATTGYAGPTGGTEENPVGTIWVAIAYEGGCHARKLQLLKDRSLNIQYTTLSALDLLRKKLAGIDFE
jgi:nicotinamide-nucleotide amidase